MNSRDANISDFVVIITILAGQLRHYDALPIHYDIGLKTVFLPFPLNI